VGDAQHAGDGDVDGASDGRRRNRERWLRLHAEGRGNADVQLNPDISAEPDETINVVLSSPTGGISLYRPNGTITIANDD
jgi:hypothetical protein